MQIHVLLIGGESLKKMIESIDLCVVEIVLVG